MWQLGFILGGSALVVSTILATFFGGLGQGSFPRGRVADRPRHLVYGLAVDPRRPGLPLTSDRSG